MAGEPSRSLHVRPHPPPLTNPSANATRPRRGGAGRKATTGSNNNTNSIVLCVGIVFTVSFLFNVSHYQKLQHHAATGGGADDGGHESRWPPRASRGVVRPWKKRGDDARGRGNNIDGRHLEPGGGAWSAFLEHHPEDAEKEKVRAVAKDERAGKTKVRATGVGSQLGNKDDDGESSDDESSKEDEKTLAPSSDGDEEKKTAAPSEEGDDAYPPGADDDAYPAHTKCGEDDQYDDDSNSLWSFDEEGGGSNNRRTVPHGLAGLDCEPHGGPTDSASEMVFWSDIPSDAKYKSPFLDSNNNNGGGSTTKNKKYLTFEPDKAGFNNVRMGVETILVLAAAMGRTLVLPPRGGRMSHMRKLKTNQTDSQYSFEDFFSLESLALEHDGLDVISMEEFLHREGTAGKLMDVTSGEVKYPPKGRVNWNDKDYPACLWEYLRRVGVSPRWGPTKCVAAIPASRSKEDVRELERMILEINSTIGREDDDEASDDEASDEDDNDKPPTPVDAPPIDRLREILGGRTELCIYDTKLQEAPLLHYSWRLLSHFYAFVYFQDWEQDLWAKRFVRDHVRYNDDIMCAASRIVKKMRKKTRKKGKGNNPDGIFDTLHIRRGDFTDWYDTGDLDAEELFEYSKDELTEGSPVYIATDEVDKSFFDIFKEHYNVYFLDDFKDQVEDIEPKYYGMVDQMVAAKGRTFFGTYRSTLSGYTNRMRGYYAAKHKLPGYANGTIDSYYFYPEDKKRDMRRYVGVRTPLWPREFPVAWTDIDRGVEYQNETTRGGGGNAAGPPPPLVVSGGDTAGAHKAHRDSALSNPSRMSASILTANKNGTTPASSTSYNQSLVGQSTGRHEHYPTPTLHEHVSNPKKTAVFIHIAKNGGTSANTLLTRLIRNTLHRKYVNKRHGNDHFDWSFAETIGNPDPASGNVEVFTTLREPVSRAVSHFYFTKTSSWNRNLPIFHQNLTEYLKDYEGLLDTRDVWQDGQAAVSWLTGTHIGSWVGCKPEWVDERERRAGDVETMLRLSAYRLDRTIWFGLVEDPTRSMELLGHVLGLDEVPAFPSSNKGQLRQKEKTGPTENEVSILRSLVPQDIWLYSYAKLLFDARYEHYKNPGMPYVHPDLPPIPDPDCTSTRFHISCKGGPLAPLEYEYKKRMRSKQVNQTMETIDHTRRRKKLDQTRGRRKKPKN